MVDVNSADGLPPSVQDLLRIFLAASSRGEHASLVLESRRKTITSKYRCVETLAGTPAPSNTPRNMEKKINPARKRRSRLRQEEYFRKKNEQAEASGNQKSADSLPNHTAGAQQLLVQLDGQQAGNLVEKVAGGIPQVDGSDKPAEEDTNEVEACFTFVSDYGDEDVRDSLRELLEDNLVPSSPTLVSRVRIEQLSADHLCKVTLQIPSTKEDFFWPELPGYPDMFKNVKML